MTAIVSKPDTHEKLGILSGDAQYDLACACSTSKEEHRTQGAGGNWIYPVSLPNGGKSVLLKTLLSNVCNNDCKYCPLRDAMDVRRCSLGAEETARLFAEYLNRGEVSGLFLSSGVIGTPDATMEQLNRTVRIIRRRYGFRGYVHLKVIPGASDAAIEEAVSLSSAVSLNIETAGEENFAKLSHRKRYIEDIIRPIKLISRLTGKGMKYSRVKQTTQFVVGAAGERDRQIVRYMGGLYQRLGMNRVYFSAYQRGLGDESLPGETQAEPSPQDVFRREHRLYQVDFLMRKYGFTDGEIPFEAGGQLSLDTDPKELWAQRHPEYFPVDANRAGKETLLRVPGLGPLTVARILQRRQYRPLRELSDIGKVGARLKKADPYLQF